jgi:regulator of replication initiation timing
LDQENVLDQFNKLEKKIEQLIDSCKNLETVNNELAGENKTLKLQLQEKIMAEKQYHDAKNVIRSKIDGLLDRLDEFTENQEGT